MATPRFMSGTNVFLAEATGQAIAYVNDPSRFALNRYIQKINCPKPVVRYAFLDPDAPVRVVTDAEFDWPWDDKRPQPKANLGNFKWEEVRIQRRSYGYMIGQDTIDNAEGINPKAFHNSIVLSLAMTNATFRCMTLLENTSNWGSNSTSSAATLFGTVGVTWEGSSDDEASARFLVIKKTVNSAIRRIMKLTNGTINRNDLRLVISPTTADMMSETAEIHHYLGQSPHALAQVKGDAPNVNAPWSLPERIYGIEIVIEPAVRVSVRYTADGTVATVDTEKDFIKSRTSAIICTKVGAGEGNYGAPSFSTVQRYYNKYEMAVEAQTDPWHKIHECHVVDAFKEVLAAPQTGFLITSVMA